MCWHPPCCAVLCCRRLPGRSHDDGWRPGGGRRLHVWPWAARKEAQGNEGKLACRAGLGWAAWGWPGCAALCRAGSCWQACARVRLPAAAPGLQPASHWQQCRFLPGSLLDLRACELTSSALSPTHPLIHAWWCCCSFCCSTRAMAMVAGTRGPSKPAVGAALRRCAPCSACDPCSDPTGGQPPARSRRPAHWLLAPSPSPLCCAAADLATKR